MGLDLLRDRGTPIERQRFDWKDLVKVPISKVDADAFTRVRIILMNGIEAEANRFQHAAARLFPALQAPLAVIRRIEQHQQTMVNWLLPADQTPLETTIAYEQTAIEVTASVAAAEPDPYMAAIFRFGLLEDFDHLYRFAALMDRVEGKDAATIVQGYTDILPGRPTALEHRHPLDDLRRPYHRDEAKLISKLGALTIMSGENQTHDFYMTIGPMFADPTARLLYAEIASIEEQHVTQYESLIDPRESALEKWLLHEACEAYNYWSCVEHETDARIREIWVRMLEYELGHVQAIAELFETSERRDAQEILDRRIRRPIAYASHRELVRDVLRVEVGLGADGARLIDRTRDGEPERTRRYRAQLNSRVQPSNIVGADWTWRPGGELSTRETGKHPDSNGVKPAPQAQGQGAKS
jgi:hypothetical protein